MVLEDPFLWANQTTQSTRDDWTIRDHVSAMGTNIWLVLCALSSQEYSLL
jgi:hypothetical protein